MSEEPPQFEFHTFQSEKRTRKKATKERQHASTLKALSHTLVETYGQCSQDFKYTLQLAPRRVLTKLSKGVHNSGYDNAEHDYICRVGDKFTNPEGVQYEIFERLGHGTFGQVLKCTDGSKNSLALKIIKNKPAYFHQALVEVHILQSLNNTYDPDDEFRIVRMRDFFVYRKHLVIAFELLSVNLYDVLKQNSFRGVSMALIRVLTEQLLRAMQCLREASIIHCDIKPENVLLSNMNHTKIKLIDFGSACFENHTVYSYVQSRFYRSPEVLLGLPYTTAVDMWSLGCICSELFLGLPIFPGHSEFDQVCRHKEILDLPPQPMLTLGKNSRRYYRSTDSDSDGSQDGSKRRERKKKLEFDMQKCYELIILESRVFEELLFEGTFDRDTVEGIRQIRNILIQGPGMLKSSREQAAVQLLHKAQESVKDGEVDVERCEVSERHNQLLLLLRDIEEACKVTRPQSPERNQTAENKKQEVKSGTDERPPTRIRAIVRESPPAVVTVGDKPAQPTESSPAKDTGSIGEQSQKPAGESLLNLLKQKVGLLQDPPDSTEKVESTDGTDPSKSGTTKVSETESSVTKSKSGGRDENTSQSDTSDMRGADSEASTAPTMQTSRDDQTKDDRNQKENQPRKKTPKVWRLKTREEFERDEHRKEQTPKKYFDFKSLEEMVQNLPYKQGLSKRAKQEDKDRRRCFLQLLWGTLCLNPDMRWTPKQAMYSSFIMGTPYDVNFQVQPDKPVPSFMKKVDKQAPSKNSNNVDIPPLPRDGLAQGNFSGGGSARTYKEKGSVGSNSEAENQPQSAPATTRGPPEKGSEEPTADKGGTAVSTIFPTMPDDNPAESYRPQIELLSDDFFRTSPRTAMAQAQKSMMMKTQNVPTPSTSSTKQMHRRSASDAPVGGSFCSSASSTGSTPRQEQKRSLADRLALGSPSVGSPSDTRKSAPTLTTAPQDNQTSTQDQPKSIAKAPGSTGPPPSPSGATTGPTGTPISATHTPQGGIPHTAHGRVGPGSQTGSRGSSPWHLPSPMSELSTASERVNSSQLSGSDSCGENALPSKARYGLDDSGEEQSQNDPHWRLHQPSDSDGTLTPGSHDTTQHTEEKKDAQHALWENIKAEMARVEMSRDRLPRRFDITQSPGSASTMGNFRQKMGMNEGGPVIPFGHRERKDGTETSTVFSPPSRQQPEEKKDDKNEEKK